MPSTIKQELLTTLEKLNNLGIANQLDYNKFYLYSIITHSTAIEGSTVTEIENQLLFDEGISAHKPMAEQLMNLDLKAAYEKSFEAIKQNPNATSEELSKTLSITDRSIKSHIAILKKEGLIIRSGGKTYGHWEIVKKEE